MSGTRGASLPHRALLRSRRIVCFVGRFLLHFLHANYVVAKEILTPGSTLAPAVVTLPLQSRTGAEIATLMALVNLTPGTLTLALDRGRDRSRLTVHGMHAGDPEAFREELRLLEERLLTAWRPVGPDPHEPPPRRSP